MRTADDTETPADLRRVLEDLARETEDGTLLEAWKAERQAGTSPWASLIHALTHLSFDETRAHDHWQRAVEHRTMLAARLGRDPGLRVALVDYFVNVEPALRAPKVIEMAAFQRTERSANTDGLTGLYNHASFLRHLQRELQRARRHSHPLSLLLLDLDDFKRLNDSRGHQEGDRALARAAALIAGNLRETDIAARYGGEEFAVILPDTTRTSSYLVAERIRARIEQELGRSMGVTVSGGLAQCPDDADGLEEIVRKADASLYQSKADGKNRITLAAGERRRHHRVPAAHPVTLGADGAHHARMTNISRSGVLVCSGEALAVGDRLELEVRPLGGGALSLSGEVVRVLRAQGRKKRFDVGLRLFGTPPPTLLDTAPSVA